MAPFEHFPYTNFQDLNLDELLRHMRELLETMKDLEKYVGGYNKRIADLEFFKKQLESGNFPDSLISSLERWLKVNVPDIISDAVHNVWFGLTDSGYFVAYIPESWRDIKFRTTGYDFETSLQPEYGHLVLLSK